MFQQKDLKHCWEVEETLSSNEAIQIFREISDGNKERYCVLSGCIYYEFVKKFT